AAHSLRSCAGGWVVMTRTVLPRAERALTRAPSRKAAAPGSGGKSRLTRTTLSAPAAEAGAGRGSLTSVALLHGMAVSCASATGMDRGIPGSLLGVVRIRWHRAGTRVVERCFVQGDPACQPGVAELHLPKPTVGRDDEAEEGDHEPVQDEVRPTTHAEDMGQAGPHAGEEHRENGERCQRAESESANRLDPLSCAGEEPPRDAQDEDDEEKLENDDLHRSISSTR